MDTDAYDDVIRRIYGGVLAPDQWDIVLEKLSAILGFSQGSILLSNGFESGTSVARGFNLNPDFARQYEEVYSVADPGKSFVSRLNAGDWYFDDRYLPDDFKEHSEFYQDFMRPHGFTSNICAALYCSKHFLAGLSFQSAVKLHNLDGSIPKRAVSSLISHLSTAVELRFKLDELARAAMLGQTLLDRIRAPVMIVNSRADVIYANSSAEAWLSNAGSMNSKEALQPSRKQELRNAVRRLFRQSPAAAGPDASTRDKASECRLVGLPLAKTHPLGELLDEPLGLLVVHQRGCTDITGAALLGELYGLSRAEQRLVVAWANHGSMRAAAEELHVSLETVRTQIKHVFAKTGCDSQIDLARLLSQLGLLM